MEKRQALNLRVPADLKGKIEEHAARYGITLNAAACILLRKAVERDGE